MEKFLEQLSKCKGKLKDKYDLSDKFLEKLYFVYPFNKFEYVINHLLAERIIVLQDYLDIREEYIERNKYLNLFEIVPSQFLSNLIRTSPQLISARIKKTHKKN